MVSPVRIALLYPQSEFFPRLKDELRFALSLGLQFAGYHQPVEWQPEFINSADIKSVEQAIKKAIYHLESQLIIVVANTKTVVELTSLYEQSTLPVIVLNLGANLPAVHWNSPFLFYNSLHSWKAQWALGKWAQQQYGGICAVNTTLYEGGYLLHEAFRLGLGAAGAASLYLNVAKNFGKQFDTSSLFQQMQQQDVSHVHAVLSGNEGQHFLDTYKQTPVINEKPLTVNAFMVDETVVPANAAMHDAVFASTWYSSLDNDANHQFVAHFSAAKKKMPSAFGLLGYETGLALGIALQTAEDIDGEVLADALSNSQPIGPRGAVSLSTSPLQADMQVHILKATFDEGAKSLQHHKIAEGEHISWQSEYIAASAAAAVAGWQNPYLFT